MVRARLLRLLCPVPRTNSKLSPNEYAEPAAKLVLFLSVRKPEEVPRLRELAARLRLLSALLPAGLINKRAALLEESVKGPPPPLVIVPPRSRMVPLLARS